MFSFSKAERFPGPKRIMNHRIAYDLPSMKSTRAAGIGYGQREIFSKKDDSPSPTNYNIKSDFVRTGGSFAKSFGIAREAYSKVYIKENPTIDPVVPGPGQYQINTLVGNEAVKYTMRPKTVIQQALMYKGQPGPGQYEPKPALNDKGNYFVSKFKSSGATTINPPSSIRFSDFSTKKHNPGPGSYSPKVELNKTGSYFVSKFMNSMCRTHYHNDRTTLMSKTLQTPGPGNYRLPSDFGYYEAQKKFGSQTFPSSSPISNRLAKSASQPHFQKPSKDSL